MTSNNQQSMGYEYYANLPKEAYHDELKSWFMRKTGKELNLEEPKTYCEKVQWLKLYDATLIKSIYADKLLARTVVSNKMRSTELLTKHYGQWRSFDEIDFDLLPEQFVLKCNHGSAWNLIVKDKSELDIADARAKFDRWLSMNYSFCSGFEMHYDLIMPTIFAEELLDIESNQIEYTVFCFDGNPEFLMLEIDRLEEKRSRVAYDFEWNKLPFHQTGRKFDGDIEKPKTLDDLFRFCKLFSEPFKFVRIDFYEIDGKLVFQEFTFTDGSGLYEFEPKEYDTVIGQLIKI